jgi:carotenoid cleavage dioxygenase-like enzyme
MHYGVVGADDRLLRQVDMSLPWPWPPRDMAFTENHAIPDDRPPFRDPGLMPG